MRRTTAGLVSLLLAGSLGVGTGPAQAAPDNETTERPAEDVVVVDDRIAAPDQVLGAGWRRSGDRAVTTAGDETGLHVLVADRGDGYQWRTAATLAEPGLDSDQWIGQLCVTGSGGHAVVVYAPRMFTNDEHAMDRGAFAAVVDLDTGTVTKLDQRVTLAYYNPSCGFGETALVSRLETGESTGTPAETWIGTVDAATARVAAAVRTSGQVTSPTPIGDRIIAAKGHAVVEVTTGGEASLLAGTDGAPFRLMADGRRGLAFQIARADDVVIASLEGNRVARHAVVPTGAVKLRSGAGGDVYAVGYRASEQVGDALPGAWKVADASPDSEPSTEGGLLVQRAVTGKEPAAAQPGTPRDGTPDTVRVETTLLAGVQPGSDLSFTVHPEPGASGRAVAASGAPAVRERAEARTPDNFGTMAADHSNVPWDPDRACAVPRNDPSIQVYQPTAKQVEWAANLAVRGQLTFQRPANWANNGLPAYSPQGYFPSKPLSGGGTVPAQVLLGILAQESNTWQASWRVADALAGNPLTSSGFYGIHWEDQDPTTINWSSVDCGYGVAQVTTGMRRDETGAVVNGVVMDYTKQKAVVLDYATNVAAGLRILQDKWNQTRDAGLIANDGDPRYIENWWFAIWAYNTGFYPDAGDDEPWGVGWSNNPASPLYPPDRRMFLLAPLDHPDVTEPDEVGYDNARHPNHWSYPERVIGWAYTALLRFDDVSGQWRPAYESAGQPEHFEDVQPNRFTFCKVVVNECDPAALHVPGDVGPYPPGPCLRDDLKCWWNSPVMWEADCYNNCGIEDLLYTTVEPRPYADSIYDSQCTTAGLPAGALIIDDIDSAVPLGPQGCARNWTSGGSFELEFEPINGPSGDTIYPGKVDFHQIGGGFGGHFWLAYTHGAADPAWRRVTGRWTVNPVNAWARVFVHLPDHGTRTQQAFYEISLPSGGPKKHRAIPTYYGEHTWVDIGVFDFTGSGNPVIELSNVTRDGAGLHTVAWDAVAVQPLSAKPDHFVVALGDSYSSGQGTDNYHRISNQFQNEEGPGNNRNECRRSPQTWSRQLTIPGASASIGALADSSHSNLDYHLLACAGAKTHHMMGSDIAFPGQPVEANAAGAVPDGPFGELPQLDRGFLDENTTLVLLTAGGNDADWSSVVRQCIISIAPCDDDPMDDVLVNITETVPQSVQILMRQIRRAAPNAVILLAGYPELFVEDCDSLEMTRAEREFLNGLSRLFAAHTVGERAVYDPLSSNTSFGVDATEESFGPVCNLFTDYVGQGINGARWDLPAPLPDSPESFHPNVDGYSMYADLVWPRLNLADYRW